MSRRRICAVTGSRADYGLLTWPMRAIRDDPELELQILVTGSHLSLEHGLSYRLIEHDGFAIDARVEMLLSGDTAVAVTKSMGLGVIGVAEALQRLQPDLLMVLGDRFETLAAVQAALIAKVPVAHLCGGDSTEGAFDESIRHAITKMANLHLVTNGPAAGRVRQLGENPEHIHVVGSPGLDAIKHLQRLDRSAFFAAVGLAPSARTLLVTYHPATLDADSSAVQQAELHAALDDLGADTGLILTGANADTDGAALRKMSEAFAAARSAAVYHGSLGQKLYLNALCHADVVVGNSSSGLYEAPSFGIPSVNIGDRQQGRLKASSVIDCEPRRDAIAAALAEALARERGTVENPYGDGESSPRIVAALKAVRDPRSLLKKHFFDLEAA